MTTRAPSWTTITIAGRWTDAIAVVLCPLAALAVMELLWRFAGTSDDRIYTIVFGFIVTGHHMPGWIRAWGEPAIRKRHLARLVVSALAIPAMVVVPAFFGLGVLAFAVASMFDLWHTSMQQHGFARIYSGKAGDSDRGGARLELACILVWYTAVVMGSDAWAMGIAQSLHSAGIGIFDHATAGAWRAFRLALGGASAVLLFFYVRRAVTLWRDKRVVAVHKHALHVVMIGVALYSYRAGSWYRAQAVQNLFHACQYFFMVWIFAHLSMKRRATEPGLVYGALFGRGRGMILFAIAVVLYGAASFWLPDLFRVMSIAEPKNLEIAASVIAASLLLHFYVDSFIWKVRDRDVKKALDIGGASHAPDHEPQWKGAVHAVAYFGVPIALVAAIGLGGRSDRARDAAWGVHAAELFPGSATALALRAQTELASGDTIAARRDFERALVAAPTFVGPALALAELDQVEGKRATLLVHLDRATRADPDDARLHLAYGVALADARRAPDAERELRRSAALAPTRPEPLLQLGLLERAQGRFSEALVDLRAADALGPDTARGAAEIAITLALMGDKKGALATTTSFLSRHPDDATIAPLAHAIDEDRVRVNGSM